MTGGKPRWRNEIHFLAMIFDFTAQTTISCFTRAEFADALCTSSDPTLGGPKIQRKGTGLVWCALHEFLKALTISNSPCNLQELLKGSRRVAGFFEGENDTELLSTQ